MSQPPAAPTPTGFVSLVGAGPGSPDLLTLRGLRALQAAEVILFDALLEPDFAALFPDQALAIPAGKRCGGLGITQERIHELLIEHASAGRRVVRLKGGDPFVFGRGGEEAQALADVGIPFEVIPGVSALQGAAAASGIPLTYRGVAREVRILEGHHLLSSNTDWYELARTEATLAIFMGTRSLKAVAQRLLDHGAPADLPVALVERAFCRGQATTISTLRLAAEGHVISRTSGPGLVYLGAAIRHRVPSLQPETFLTDAHDPLSALPRSDAEASAPGGGRKRRAG
jgi:uroporphyrin-III C-methyltransferase